MCPDHDATYPDADTCDPRDASPIPVLALVVLWSAAEPHRVGEIAFLPGSDWWFIGRGDEKIEEFANFTQQCPGQTVDDGRRAPCLRGKSMSARQVAVRVNGVGIEMKQVGTCLTLVNGEDRSVATLTPGDTILIRGVALLLCIRRPRTLPALDARELEHLFGERDLVGIVGESLAALTLRNALVAAARSPYDVLVLGGSGSGKEMAAAAIHLLSARKLGPYITASAAVFTSTLAESKLFGQAQNYPNPGTPARKGLFSAADGGTLLLDEIGDCPAEIQPYLLRVMETGELTPLGESIARHIDVRVVAATNRELHLLRQELLMRLKKRVRVPALSERREDIPLILRYLALQRALVEPELMKPFMYTGPSGRTEVRMSGRVVDFLVRHPLTGNVRELEILFDGLISNSRGNEVRLPSTEDPASAGPSSVVPESVAPASGKPTRQQALQALKSANGNAQEAAEIIGMHRSSFYRLMKDYGLKPGSVG